jgi:hypothetical protein
MLAVHLPRERILFTSDIIGLEPFFSSWLKASGFAPERIFAMHRADPTTVERLEKQP